MSVCMYVCNVCNVCNVCYVCNVCNVCNVCYVCNVCNVCNVCMYVCRDPAVAVTAEGDHCLFVDGFSGYKPINKYILNILSSKLFCSITAAYMFSSRFSRAQPSPKPGLRRVCRRCKCLARHRPLGPARPSGCSDRRRRPLPV